MRFKEVLNPDQANRVVVISEAYGHNYVRKKVYFYLPGDMGVKTCLMYVLDNYSDLLGCDIRLDVYQVRNGRIVGRA